VRETKIKNLGERKKGDDWEGKGRRRDFSILSFRDLGKASSRNALNISITSILNSGSGFI
jgi:hypothetical protein